MAEFSHFNAQGRAHMVDVSAKKETERQAMAAGSVRMNAETFQLVKTGGIKKGDVLAVAQVAGIMAAKRTSDLIPMCHPLPLTSINIDFSLNEEELVIEIRSTVKCTGVTGVEMEALTAVSVAALTIYDMCKAVQKDMIIDNVRLLKKSGGKSGDYSIPD